MQQGVRFTEVWHMWFFAGNLIWYRTHKHTKHTQGPVDCHTHINIYLHHSLCGLWSYLYCTEWFTFTDIKNLLSTTSFLFKNYSLVKVIYLLIRCCKTRFFLWNTYITDRNGVNKQNTYTHAKHSEKHNTGANQSANQNIFYQNIF